MNTVSLRSISRSFGDIHALTNFSLDITGGCVGILGPNGSGKTTLMKILTGLLRPDQGEAYINDISVQKEPKRAMKYVGSLIEQPEFYPYLTGRETLEFVCRIRGLSALQTGSEISRISGLTGCRNYLDRRTGGYSRGMKQRLGLSIALAADPEVLVLDEPTFGLDPRGIREIGELIMEIKKRKSILLSTHIIAEARQLCDRVIIMEKGVQKYDSSQGENRAAIRIELEDGIRGIPDLSQYGEVSFHNGGILIRKNDGVRNHQVVDLLVRAGLKVNRLDDFDSLESTYMSIISESSN